VTCQATTILMRQFTVRRFSTPRAFLEHAERILLQDEARNNLLLTIPRSLIGQEHDLSGPEGPLYFATVQDPPVTLGCAVRTPPNKLVLSRMPSEAATAIARDVAEVYPTLPAVLAPPDVAEAFAAVWAQAHDILPRIGMRSRIYAVETLVPPTANRWPIGGARLATPADLGTLVPWITDTARPYTDPRALARALVDQQAALVWERDGTPMAMAAVVGTTPNGVRIGAVYTPPAERGQGFGTAVTHAVTERALRQRTTRFAFLYTDLANPTSNTIYQRIGYRPVGDAVDVHFE
jgi:GNAT superfamily N-acetyltransferase